MSYNSGTNTTTVDSSFNLIGNLIIDAVTISKDELKYLDGVSSNIQTQFTDLDGVTNNLNDKTTKMTYDGATDSNLTVSDVFKVGNVIHTPGTNYIIENTTATGSLVIRNKDAGSTIREMMIDQFIKCEWN